MKIRDSSIFRSQISDAGFGGSSQSYSRGFEPSGKRDAGATGDLDGLLTPFEKNFYVEAPSVAAMTEEEVEAYRRKREITVEGRDVPKPVREFQDIGFPGSYCYSTMLQDSVPRIVLGSRVRIFLLRSKDLV